MALQLSAQKREMDLAKLSHPVAAETSPASSSDCKSTCSIKRHKHQMKCFFGDHFKWHEFWDSFSVSIHNNTQLTTIGKFLYLNSLIKGDAEKVIAGFPLTEIHYKQAIHALQDRFGDSADSIPSEVERDPVESPTVFYEESDEYRNQRLADRIPSQLGSDVVHERIMHQAVLVGSQIPPF
ncbi:MAG: DUF1759 domain-containing protein [Gammaproteobacteria bacterium]|nr:DUF1759 domain-containing protein [Gammaproteobacteria bacterium]